MNPDQIAQVFQSLGRIEQKIDGHTQWMTKHVEDDKLIASDVRKLQIAAARQKGFIAALGAAAAFISGIVGYVIEYFVSGRGHH
jgi:hypothetical protein